MQVIIIKWWIIKPLKTLCFCTSSQEIDQWNVHCSTPVTESHWNHITIWSHICKISPSCFRMLQVHDNMPPVKRIISTRVKHKCICTGKFEAFITATGDHWHCSRIWQVCSRAPLSKKWTNIQKASGQSTATNNDNQSRSLELPCKISYMGT